MTSVNKTNGSEPSNFWLVQIVKLATRNLPAVDETNPSLDPQKVFHRAMESLFDDVHARAPEKSLGKRLTNDEVRKKIIFELWDDYSSKVDNSRLMKSEFLRKLGKHSPENDSNLKNIDKIIKNLLLEIPNGQEFINDPDFISAARHIGAVIYKPEEFAEQDYLMKYLPSSKRKKFADGYAKIDAALNEAKANQWFTSAPGTLNTIIKEIANDQTAVLHNREKVDRGTLLAFVVYHAMELINSEKEDRETFKQAVLSRIKEFSAGLTVHKTQLVSNNI